jgi:hypothetical protein
MVQDNLHTEPTICHFHGDTDAIRRFRASTRHCQLISDRQQYLGKLRYSSSHNTTFETEPEIHQRVPRFSPVYIGQTSCRSLPYSGRRSRCTAFSYDHLHPFTHLHPLIHHCLTHPFYWLPPFIAWVSLSDTFRPLHIHEPLTRATQTKWPRLRKNMIT